VKQSATLDSSFWINAHKSRLSSYLLAEFDITCASGVCAEISTAFSSGREFWRLVQEEQIKTSLLREVVFEGFGLGEREAISLALEHPGWVFQPFAHQLL